MTRLYPGGRKRKNGEFVGVTMKFPAVLLYRIDRFAIDEFCLNRAEALSELLARGLATTVASRDETFQFMNQAFRSAHRKAERG